MKVILTEEEYKKLVPIDECDKMEKAVEWADRRIVGDRCFHTHNPTSTSTMFEFCDLCPLSHTANKYMDEEVSRKLCSRTRYYKNK
jgi:hypothetical protein